MPFVIPAAHTAAVQEACRIPALNARLALLTTPATPPTIEFYADPIPDPWDSGIPDPAPTPVVTLTMAPAVGTVDEALFQIQFTAPIEAQVTGADPSTGTAVTWAAIYDGDGGLWGYGTVSAAVGSGDFKLQTTTLLQGAFARLISGVVQG
jgi:hypothetical protein